MKRDFTGPRVPAKEEIRRAMRETLRAMDAGYRAEASLVISGLAAQLPAFREGSCIALFFPLASEPNIHPLIEEAWAQGKRIAFPRMHPEGREPRLIWHAVAGWDELSHPGPFGLREPDMHCPLIHNSELSCVFVPGLAFDAHGMRLGRGGGFYDHFLGEASPKLPRYGLFFARQRVEKLPSELHDQALPAIITEDGVLSFST